MNNYDSSTVDGFGFEWSRFDQSAVSLDELARAFEEYFSIFPWDSLPADPVGFDMGCGSGRWAFFAAERVARLYCVDASPEALEVAKKNLAGLDNCEFILASVDTFPIENGTMDFGYSLGVLHHVPYTSSAIKSCADKLKPGAPLLLYLYYAFDNRPFWFRLLWQFSDALRKSISKFPDSLKYAISQLIALFVYLPLARTAKLLSRLGINTGSFPLSFYRDRSFYTMRTDSLDRFGTRLEQRFTAEQIRHMMESAGLEDIRISDAPPFWCAVGFRKKQ